MEYLHLPLIGCYICTYIRSRQTGLYRRGVLPVQTCPWILISSRSGKRCTLMRESFMCFVVINRKAARVCVCVRVCVCYFLSTVPVTPNPLHCRLYLAIRACWHCLSSVMCGDSVPMCISMRLSGHPWKNLGKTSLITLGLSRRLSRGAEYE